MKSHTNFYIFACNTGSKRYKGRVGAKRIFEKGGYQFYFIVFLSNFSLPNPNPYPLCENQIIDGPDPDMDPKNCTK
jgi:hypothetical protein